MTLSFNEIHLFNDVSPLNKVFTALHRLTSVFASGTISECKSSDLFDFIIVFLKFMMYFYLKHFDSPYLYNLIFVT